MQVTSYVAAALEDAPLYAALEHKPDVSALFVPAGSPDAPLLPLDDELDLSFANVFNQPCGYYQLKRWARSIGEEAKLDFLERVTEYRLTGDPVMRLARCVGGCGREEGAGRWHALHGHQLTSPHHSPRHALTHPM